MDNLKQDAPEGTPENSISIISPFQAALQWHKHWNAQEMKIRTGPSKKPLESGNGAWEASMMLDEAAIKDYFDSFKMTDAPNWAILCGEPKARIFVIDIDVKNGARGMESYRAFMNWVRSNPVLYKKLTNAIIIKTPSGGYHIYLVCEDDFNIPNKVGVGAFGGIDLQGARCYVLGEGSTINGKQYRRFSGVEGEPLTADQISQDDIVHIESMAENKITAPEMLKMLEWFNVDSTKIPLKKDPTTVKVGERDAQTFRKGLNLKGTMPEDEALEKLHEYNAGMPDPLPLRDVQAKHNSAQKKEYGDTPAMPATTEMEPAPLLKHKKVQEVDFSNIPDLDFMWKQVQGKTEADKLLWAVSYIVLMSSGLGNKVEFYDQHAQLFVMLVGTTSSNKGTSNTLAERMIEEAFGFKKGGNPIIFRNAGSAQGLVSALEDPQPALGFHDDAETIEEAHRLAELQTKNKVMIWAEFEEILSLGAQAGSTLHQKLNLAYDNNVLENVLKKEIKRASNYSLGMVAHCTKEALQEKVTGLLARNGTMNRIPHFSGISKTIMYDGLKLEFSAELLDLVREHQARALCAAVNHTKMEVASDAKEMFKSAVDKIHNIEKISIPGNINARARATFARFIINFILVFDPETHADKHANCEKNADKVTYIQKHHITNAMIFAEISIDTVNETYSTNHETFQILDMLEGWSQTSNTMTAEAIRKDIFSGNTSAKHRQKLLKMAMKLDLLIRDKEKEKEGPGRRVTTYTIVPDAIEAWKRIHDF